MLWKLRSVRANCGLSMASYSFHRHEAAYNNITRAGPRRCMHSICVISVGCCGFFCSFFILFFIFIFENEAAGTITLRPTVRGDVRISALLSRWHTAVSHENKAADTTRPRGFDGGEKCLPSLSSRWQPYVLMRPELGIPPERIFLTAEKSASRLCLLVGGSCSGETEAADTTTPHVSNEW